MAPLGLSLSANRLFTVCWAFMFVVINLNFKGRQKISSILILFSLKSIQVTVKQKHEMSFMDAVYPKTCLDCKGVVVSLGEVNVLQTSLYADCDTKMQKLR